MSESEKTNSSMISQSSVLRVCMSCWSRLPGAFRFSQGITTSQITSSRFTCSNICGLKWLKPEIYPQNMLSKRLYSSEPKTKIENVANIETNPYFDKYKEKLKKKESESPEEFRGKLEELEENERERLRQRKEDLTTPPSTEQNTDNKPHAADLSGKWPPKSLDEIMKVDLIKDKSPKEIDNIWKEYHLQKDCVFAVISGSDYDDVIQKSKVCPLFIYPLRRNDGYEFIFAQFNGKDIYFTPLQMYQSHKENAPVCLTVAHFPELKEEKGLVLMAGKYDDNILNKKEALSLVRQMSHYYGQNSKDRFRYVEWFNRKPDCFSHEDLISEYNNMEKSLESEY